MRTPAQELQDHLDGETVAEANKRVQRILRETAEALPSPVHPFTEIGAYGPGVQPFTLPEVPAAVQEAGDQAWVASAMEGKHNSAAGPNLRRAPRSDKGKPRPKPQPVPEPEQKAGGITLEMIGEINRLISIEFMAREEFSDAEFRLKQAIDARQAYLDSLAK